jgi:hypothetical protein
MKKHILFVVSLVLISNAAFAMAYRCEYVEVAPGRPSYMLVVQNGLPSHGAGVILSQNHSTGRLGWNLVDGDAQVLRIPDGGPLKIGSRPLSGETSQIDWNAPANKDQCYVVAGTSYYFNIYERTTGIKGDLATISLRARNPNKTTAQCPLIMEPMHSVVHPLSCYSL